MEIKREKTGNRKVGLFRALYARLVASEDYKKIPKKARKRKAEKKAAHYVYMGGGNPVFIPRYHSKISYATQQRIARKRKKAK